ncbi:nucleotidyltransferase domain-containing protein [Apibacter raozihei]|uniref:nucleotidyltransferase domain-containing protein n=1 Tax=Apibacter raozihei TaxID=2500547 RepID=UPI000FE39888|nr:nucleotidyltransferase domain-containing protein [Apibacter raozihei]
MNIQDIKDKNLLLFEAISGSRAFGLDTENSDTDIRGVYYLPKDKFYGFDYIPQISNETNDEVYYELGRFVELLVKNNPNILEVLASPQDCILYKHPIMEKLNLSMFLSKLVKDTFAGYAISQIKKAQGLKKKIVNPIEKQRKSVLDFCYVLSGYDSVLLSEWLQIKNFKQENCGLISIPHSKGIYALFYDQKGNLGYRGITKKDDTNEVSLSSIAKGEKEIAYLSFNKDGYSSYCKEYKEYWNWVDKRNKERFKINESHGNNYDSKNMMHTIRLLEVARDIFQNGELIVRRSNREELLNIKYGRYSYEELLQKSEDLIKEIENLYSLSSLQNVPDSKIAESLLIEMRKHLYE